MFDRFDSCVCETCGRGCEDNDRYCDGCWEEISSDELSDNRPSDSELESMEITTNFRSFSADFDISYLDNPF